MTEIAKLTLAIENANIAEDLKNSIFNEKSSISFSPFTKSRLTRLYARQMEQNYSDPRYMEVKLQIKKTLKVLEYSDEENISMATSTGPDTSIIIFTDEQINHVLGLVNLSGLANKSKNLFSQ